MPAEYLSLILSMRTRASAGAGFMVKGSTLLSVSDDGFVAPPCVFADS